MALTASSPSRTTMMSSLRLFGDLFLYGRSRGEYFVRKVNAKVGAKHHKTLQSALGTAAVITEKKATEATDKEEQSPGMKYLTKQQSKG